METRYHHHRGHNIPHCGGEGVLNTANSKANDRTLMQFMPLSPSILGVCRRSKYARWRDTIDEDDTWIWGLDSMIKPSAASDYIYHALPWTVGGGWRLVFFHFDTTTFQFRPKKYFFECESAPSTQDCDDPKSHRFPTYRAYPAKPPTPYRRTIIGLSVMPSIASGGGV